MEVYDNHLDVLMFANDIVMFSTSPVGLQKQLGVWILSDTKFSKVREYYYRESTTFTNSVQ